MMKVTGENFDREVLQSDLPVLVDFYADWCGPCQMMAPVVHQLAEDRADRLKVVQVNVDEAQALAVSCGVSSIPTLAYFRGGKLRGSSVGALPRETLEEKLAEWERD